ncbi:MAG: peptidase M20, partial [Bacteroidales bacterium]
MDTIKTYIETHKQRFLDELFGLIRIPSISSEISHKEDMLLCAEYWKKSILQAGADKAEVMPSK